jgi:hypothetical protein
MSAKTMGERKSKSKQEDDGDENMNDSDYESCSDSDSGSCSDSDGEERKEGGGGAAAAAAAAPKPKPKPKQLVGLQPKSFDAHANKALARDLPDDLRLLRTPTYEERRGRWMDTHPMVSQPGDDAAQYRISHKKNASFYMSIGTGWVSPNWTSSAGTRELLQNLVDAVRTVALEVGGIKGIAWRHVTDGGNKGETRRIMAVGVPILATDRPVCLGSITWERVLPDNEPSCAHPKKARKIITHDKAQQLEQKLALAVASGVDKVPASTLAAAIFNKTIASANAALAPCPAKHGSDDFVAEACTCRWRLVLENEAVRLLNHHVMCVGKTSKTVGGVRRAQYARDTDVDGPIGHFGEGLKMALLVLCKNGARTRICTNNQMWSFELDDDELHQELVLASNPSTTYYLRRYIQASLGPSIAQTRPRPDTLRVVVDQLHCRDVDWSRLLDLRSDIPAKIVIRGPTRLTGAELLIANPNLGIHPVSNIRSNLGIHSVSNIRSNSDIHPGACYHRGIWVENVDYLPFAVNLLGEVNLNRDRERLPREFADAGSFLRTTLGRLCDLQVFNVQAVGTNMTLAELLYNAFFVTQSDACKLLVKAARTQAAYPDGDATKLGCLARLLWGEALRRAGHQNVVGRVFPLLADGHAADETYTREASLSLLHEARLYDTQRPWQAQCLDVPPLLYHMCATSSILADVKAASVAFRNDMFRDTPILTADTSQHVAATLVQVDKQLSRALGRSMHVVVHDVAPLRATNAGRARLHDENLSIMRLVPSNGGSCTTVEVLSPLLFEHDWFHRVHGDDGQACGAPCDCVKIYLVEWLVGELHLSWTDVAKRNMRPMPSPPCLCGVGHARYRASLVAPVPVITPLAASLPMVAPLPVPAPAPVIAPLPVVVSASILGSSSSGSSSGAAAIAAPSEDDDDDMSCGDNAGSNLGHRRPRHAFDKEEKGDVPAARRARHLSPACATTRAHVDSCEGCKRAIRREE